MLNGADVNALTTPAYPELGLSPMSHIVMAAVHHSSDGVEPFNGTLPVRMRHLDPHKEVLPTIKYLIHSGADPIRVGGRLARDPKFKRSAIGLAIQCPPAETTIAAAIVRAILKTPMKTSTALAPPSAHARCPPFMRHRNDHTFMDFLVTTLNISHSAPMALNPEVLTAALDIMEMCVDAGAAPRYTLIYLATNLHDPLFQNEPNEKYQEVAERLISKCSKTRILRHHYHALSTAVALGHFKIATLIRDGTPGPPCSLTYDVEAGCKSSYCNQNLYPLRAPNGTNGTHPWPTIRL